MIASPASRIPSILIARILSFRPHLGLGRDQLHRAWIVHRTAAYLRHHAILVDEPELARFRETVRIESLDSHNLGLRTAAFQSKDCWLDLHLLARPRLGQFRVLSFVAIYGG